MSRQSSSINMLVLSDKVKFKSKKLIKEKTRNYVQFNGLTIIRATYSQNYTH